MFSGGVSLIMDSSSLILPSWINSFRCCLIVAAKLNHWWNDISERALMRWASLFTFRFDCPTRMEWWSMWFLLCLPVLVSFYLLPLFPPTACWMWCVWWNDVFPSRGNLVCAPREGRVQRVGGIRDIRRQDWVRGERYPIPEIALWKDWWFLLLLLHSQSSSLPIQKTRGNYVGLFYLFGRGGDECTGNRDETACCRRRCCPNLPFKMNILSQLCSGYLCFNNSTNCEMLFTIFGNPTSRASLSLTVSQSSGWITSESTTDFTWII